MYLTDFYYVANRLSNKLLADLEGFGDINYPVDIYTTDDKMVIDLAVVGSSKEEVSVKRKGNEITVSRKKKDEEPRHYICNKISRKDFTYSFAISDKYNVENMKVKMEKGLLQVSIPIAESFSEQDVEIG